MSKRLTKATRDERAAKGQCRTCNNKAAVRGLCWTCYRVFDRKRKRQELDETLAIEAGLVSPSAKRGVKGGSGFEKALKDK